MEALADPSRQPVAIRRPKRGAVIRALAFAVVGSLPACASAPLVQGLTLSSYEGLSASDGMITKSRVRVNEEVVSSASASVAHDQHLTYDILGGGGTETQ